MVYGDTETVPVDHILSFLDDRVGKLDALSITGGEPMLHEDIGPFMKEVKDRGFLVKVDTNGTFPDRLEELLNNDLVDYVSMDVKAPIDKYDTLAGVYVDVEKIKRSIKLIMEKAPDYEFKTTMIPGLLEKEDVKRVASLIPGAKRYYLQQFKTDVPVINQELLSATTPFSPTEFNEMKDLASPFVESCLLRGV
jgi:pyruvate formate lyase activating enzyme